MSFYYRLILDWIADLYLLLIPSTVILYLDQLKDGHSSSYPIISVLIQIGIIYSYCFLIHSPGEKHSWTSQHYVYLWNRMWDLKDLGLVQQSYTSIYFTTLYENHTPLPLAMQPNRWLTSPTTTHTPFTSYENILFLYCLLAERAQF